MSSEHFLLKANRLREVRESLMISKMELARRAGISNLTVNRIENGADCRMETKRKILAALGLSARQKESVFPEQ